MVETELVLLRQLHDHRGGHRLGIRGGPEIRVGAGLVRGVHLSGAVGGGKVTLRRAQENDGAGDQERLRGRIHHDLQRSLVDWLER